MKFNADARIAQQVVRLPWRAASGERTGGELRPTTTSSLGPGHASSGRKPALGELDRQRSRPLGLTSATLIGLPWQSFFASSPICMAQEIERDVDRTSFRRRQSFGARVQIELRLDRTSTEPLFPDACANGPRSFATRRSAAKTLPERSGFFVLAE
ncbi:MAG: hypothetical protein C4334_13940 [Pyrinomonas sp.]